MSLRDTDIRIINFFKEISVPASRIGLFVIFFWFGALKVAGLSPASPLVQALFEKTIHFMNFGSFMALFGIFECLIGLMFLFKGFERIVIPLLFLHMAATFLPLFLLPQITWSGFLVPTLEGQYIIKNLVIIASAIGIAAHLHAIPAKKNF
jgi:uncharacterized membrane protein YkgB